MNQDRRKEIADALAKLMEAISIIETAKDEEQEYFDNMPENLQQGERGQAAESAAEALSEAYDSMESARESLEGIES